MMCVSIRPRPAWVTYVFYVLFVLSLKQAVSATGHLERSCAAGRGLLGPRSLFCADPISPWLALGLMGSAQKLPVTT